MACKITAYEDFNKLSTYAQIFAHLTKHLRLTLNLYCKMI